MLSPQLAQACAFLPGAGDDIYICDSGISAGPLADTVGNNTLQLLAPGGTITGGVTFGGGIDLIEMDAGTINGPVIQRDGDDDFVISGGTVDGNVQQGIGEDDFIMSDGVIGSLNQGDSLDYFEMTGGRIIDSSTMATMP